MESEGNWGKSREAMKESKSDIIIAMVELGDKSKSFGLFTKLSSLKRTNMESRSNF
jgi:hypothetical protein